MSTYFIHTYNCEVTRKQEDMINARIKAIDSDAVFVRHYAAGNHVHGWIERPNDGTNDYNIRRAKNAKLVRIADEVLLSHAS